MKSTLLSLLLIVTIISSSTAQWTTDPANPAIVSNSTGTQNAVQSIADGQGGIYTFWLNSGATNTSHDIMGQHYNEQGVAQFENNGRELVNYPGKVTAFSFIKTEDNEFIFTWTINNSANTEDNGVYARRVDSELQSIWEEDVKIFAPSNMPNTMFSARIVKSLNAYYIAMHSSQIGGQYALRLNKIDIDGNFLWEFNGQSLAGIGSLANYNITSDENGGCYVYYHNTNAGGAVVRCMRVNGPTSLQNVWPAWKELTEGTAGINIQYSAIGDPAGITFVWQGAGEGGSLANLYARRFTASSGALSWNGETKNICAIDGEQRNFFWKKSGSNYYITWADARPGVISNSAIYAQKFDMDGTMLWEENGVQVANLGSYIPNPEFDLDENNTMCITHKANPAFVAHKVSTTGSVGWGPSGITALISSLAPIYEDYDIVYTGGKFIVVAPTSSYNIRMTKIEVPQVQVTENVTACNTYHIGGEDYNESGTYTLSLHPDTVITLHLTIIQNVAEINVNGNTLSSANSGNYQWFECTSNQPIAGATSSTFTPTTTGMYALQLTNGECVSMSECEMVTIVSVEEVDTQKTFLVYPNPGEDWLAIPLASLNFKPTQLDIFNSMGQLVYSQKIMQHELITTATSTLANGIYTLQLRNDTEARRAHWIKK